MPRRRAAVEATGPVRTRLLRTPTLRFLGALIAVATIGCNSATPTATPATSATATPAGVGSGDPRLGVGETLIVIVGGRFETRAEAERFAAEMARGGGPVFHVDQASNYQGRARYAIEEVSLRYLGPPPPAVEWPEGGWLAATAFRTRAGAQTLLPLIRFAEIEVQAWQVVKLGGEYVGLGRELHPDGSGPLTAPLPDQERYQR
jgi:hypothetical protein